MSVRIYVIYNESMRVTLLASLMSFYEIRLGLFDMPHNICVECVTPRKKVITFQMKFAELRYKFFNFNSAT